MLDVIRTATIAEYEAVWQLFVDVCEQQANDRYGAKWTLDVYPTQDDIRTHIEANELYIGFLDGQIAATMVLTPHEDPEYADVPWTTACNPNDVSVVHLLAVHPSMRGKHLGEELVLAAISISRDMGKRVIHLDVVPDNLAASRIYQQVGFSLVCTYQIYYEDTGLADFDMYEYVL